jgi:hypothetical protein
MIIDRKISVFYVNHINDCKLRIFVAEDEDYPNGRIVARNERAQRSHIIAVIIS